MTRRDQRGTRRVVVSTLILRSKSASAWFRLKSLFVFTLLGCRTIRNPVNLFALFDLFDSDYREFISFAEIIYIFPTTSSLTYMILTRVLTFDVYLLAWCRTPVRPTIYRFYILGEKHRKSRLPVKWKMMIITSNQDGLVCILQIS